LARLRELLGLRLDEGVAPFTQGLVELGIISLGMG
jgi:hypothetical protein